MLLNTASFNGGLSILQSYTVSLLWDVHEKDEKTSITLTRVICVRARFKPPVQTVYD